MRGVFSPTQLAHRQKGIDLFFSPEAKAMANDPELAEIREVAMLDHLFGGWKNLTDKGIDGRTGKPIAKFGLAVDDPIELDRAELLQAQINEVKNALEETEEIEGFRQLSPENRAEVESAILKHIAGTDIGNIGGLGTNRRRYPNDYPDASLAGTIIPVSWVGFVYDSKCFTELTGCIHVSYTYCLCYARVRVFLHRLNTGVYMFYTRFW